MRSGARSSPTAAARFGAGDLREDDDPEYRPHTDAFSGRASMGVHGGASLLGYGNAPGSVRDGTGALREAARSS